MKVFLIGYPSEIGGACTEALATVKLWRQFGVEVDAVPTWTTEPPYREIMDGLGCTTHITSAGKLDKVPGLAGSTCVAFCNEKFCNVAHILRRMGCKLIFSPCMCYLFGHEKHFIKEYGSFEAMQFQSEYQRSCLEPYLAKIGYQPETGHLIRGAFDFTDWEFAPTPHEPGTDFVLGKLARPDPDKWSSNLWPIYGRVQYCPFPEGSKRKALVMGMNDRCVEKLGRLPEWAEVLPPKAIPVKDYYKRIHCLLTVNGGAAENWPRIGLEAMAVGVPVIAQNMWGWSEMIEHGVTGFLGSTDEELAHYASVLAHDEDLRIAMARRARAKLENELANPTTIWAGWERLFESVKGASN